MKYITGQWRDTCIAASTKPRRVGPSFASDSFIGGWKHSGIPHEEPRKNTILAQPGQETSWILPLGGMARVGFKVEWLEGACKLMDPRGQRIPVMVREGCLV